MSDVVASTAEGGAADVAVPAYQLIKPSTPSEAALVRLIGALPALKLVEAYGGFSMDVPRSLDRKRKLLEIVGPQAARVIVEHYGGGRMNVPLARAWRACVYRTRDGATIAEIARRLSATTFTVIRWLKEGGVGGLSAP